MAKDIIGTIIQEWSTDFGSDEIKDNERIEKMYNKASDTEKELIDDIFISICGYGLGTLIEKAPKI